MSKTLRVGMIGYRFMGKAHSNAWRQAPRFFPLKAGVEMVTICGRDPDAVEAARAQFGWQRASTDWREVVNSPDIDIVDVNTPNESHAEISIAAAKAGKHVLCEKPLSMDVAEAKTLLEVRARTGVKICEAFMIRSAPQWLRAHQLLGEGRVGELRAVNAHFSYFNVNPENIRNRIETGGGGVYDIGCYCIQSARYGFGQEPTRVVATLDRDPQLGTDRLASAILEFPSGHAIFTCSTQLIPYQRVHFLGTRGRIEIEIPFNAPNDRPTRLFVDSSGDLASSSITVESFPACDQYTLQGDAFAKSILENTDVPVPLEDSIANMAVIDAIFRSAETGQWEAPER